MIRPELRLIGALLFVVSACASVDDPSGPSDPVFPDVRGTYAGHWSFSFTGLFNNPVQIECPGNVAVTGQSADVFSGGFTLQAADGCAESVLGTVIGQVRTDGGVSFQIDVPSAGGHPFDQLTGCAFRSGDQQLRGVHSDNALSVNTTVEIECTLNAPPGVPDPFTTHRTDWHIAFSGIR